MQPRLLLIAAAGALVRLDIEGLSLGSRNSLPVVSQLCVVTASLAAASHNFCFSGDGTACLWLVARDL